MFTAIKINDEKYRFKTGDLETEINGLNKINIFVGQNNSGKSRFMRSIFSNKSGVQNIDNREEGIDKYNDLVGKIKGYGINGYGFPSKIQVMNKIPYKTFTTSMQNEKHAFVDFKQHCNSSRVYLSNMNQSGILDVIYGVNEEELFQNKIYKIVYIPLIRGLKNPLFNSKTDIYKNRTIYDYYYPHKNNEAIDFEDYNLKNFHQRDFEIFTGLSLYEDIKNMLLGTHEQRENIKDFEDFLSINFFNGDKITLIPNNKDDVLYVDIGKIKNKAIYDLGDGIQSIIINTFPLFRYKDENLLLFIEEPEIGIHPGMQRILLNTFATGIDGQKGEHQIYFTTHSNHFLDIALDKEINDRISVYQFKETENEIEKHITNISKNKEILDLLGVRNSSVFLSNCVIWVEGVSDRIYIKKFLELYQNQDGIKKFEEDKHFSIIEYGGGNITHFNFGEDQIEKLITIESLTSNNFLVGDNDGSNSSVEKKERIKQLKRIKKDLCWFDIPEVENLLTFEVYKKYFDDLEEHGKRNWKKKTSFDEALFKKDINDKDIGEIMRNVFIEYKNKKLKGFERFKKINDIKIIFPDKKAFAEKIVNNYLNDYSALSPKAKELTKKLYGFIEKNNT